MNTTIDKVKEYLKQEYDLDFYYETYGTHKWLKYSKNKKEYTLHCDYAYQAKEDADVWCIYEDFMDYNKWYGNGSAVKDNGKETLDLIMKEWGFEKKQQLSLF